MALVAPSSSGLLPTLALEENDFSAASAHMNPAGKIDESASSSGATTMLGALCSYMDPV
jgi:hypothetical protein